MSRNRTTTVEILLILLLTCVPLFIRLPYRANIFLSWEGAYRISQGQLPFRDFGTPLGGMYWVIPAIFFKLFGTKMITLIKAQFFINIVAGLSFRSILRSLSVNKGIRLVGILLFCISYSFFNFWPWYNHSVIVYELVGLAFLLRYMRTDGGDWKKMGWLAGAAFFLCCSFLTKQDGGGLAFLIAFGLVAVYSLFARQWQPLAVFTASYVLILFLMILPFLKFGFGYWFNHGQAPHSSRVSAFDIADEFFGFSEWIKFYFFLTVILLLARYRSRAALLADKNGILLVVLTWGILAEAAVFQVTSYTPPDNNIFFHSFAIVCILSLMAPLLQLNFERPRTMIVAMAGIMLWWSGIWWKYTQRIASKLLVHQQAVQSPTGENVVNRATYTINTDTTKDIPMSQWVETGLSSFDRITMPPPTVDGIHRLMGMDLVKNSHGDLRVLNMSELTPLAAEIPYKLERNSQMPLWFHLGVGMFNRQAQEYESRVGQHYYDLILFEHIPRLNNFYAFRVRDSIRQHYRQVDSFLAPRQGITSRGIIEVYVK